MMAWSLTAIRDFRYDFFLSFSQCITVFRLSSTMEPFFFFFLPDSPRSNGQQILIILISG